MPGSSPALYELAEALRTIREEAKVTQKELAEQIGCTQGLIGHWERARKRIGEEDLSRLLLALKASPAKHAEIQRLRARTLEPKASWRHFQLLGGFRPMVSLEGEAAREDTYQSVIIPGLLQTQAYAYASHSPVFGKVPEKSINKWVAARLLRQNRLHEQDPMRLRAVIFEAALRIRIGSIDVHADQLQHLVDLAQLENISINVLTFADGHTGISSGFTLLHFDNARTKPSIGYFDGPTRNEIIDHPQEVDNLVEKFDHALSVALPARQSVEFISELRAQLLVAGVSDGHQ